MATKPDWPSLEQGNKGINVYAVQCLLVQHGATIAIDGSYGSNTKEAVKNFQKDHKITPEDGSAGPKTLPSMVMKVSKGTKNDAAKAAQYLMNKFEAIDVDGSFGAASEAATKAFQKGMGIAQSASVDATTWQYLFGYNMYPDSSAKDAYASVCTYPSTLKPSQMNTNAKYICNYLMRNGFTKNAACGILGNMEQESGINPGIWETFNDTTRGYGLVQWTPATNFLNWAKDEDEISEATPIAANALALSDSVKLMEAQLSCLLWCCTENHDFYKPTTDSMNHTGIKLTFDEYKASTLDAGTLAIVFHDHYERSKAGESLLQERADIAMKWFNSL